MINRYRVFTITEVELYCFGIDAVIVHEGLQYLLRLYSKT